MHPWIQALTTVPTAKIEMADGLNLSFSKFFITNITGLSYNMCPKSVLKLILWINAHIFQHKGCTVSTTEYNYSILLLKWLTPINGGSVFSLF